MRLAKKLDVPFYDKLILAEIAESRGIDTNLPEFTIDTPKETMLGNLFGTKIADRNELKPLLKEIA